jgi:hypothetical protein
LGEKARAFVGKREPEGVDAESHKELFSQANESVELSKVFPEKFLDFACAPALESCSRVQKGIKTLRAEIRVDRFRYSPDAKIRLFRRPEANTEHRIYKHADS